MKNFFALIAFFSIIIVNGQNKIADDIAALQSAGKSFKSFSVLTATSAVPNAQINNTVENATIATINTAGINAIVSARPQTITVDVPYDGAMISVLLYKAEISNEAFYVATDKIGNVEYQQGAHYRGIVDGDPTSLVALNFFPNEMSGIVSTSSFNNLVIGKIDKPFNTTEYIIYSDGRMKIPNGFRCDVKDDDAPDNHDDHNRDNDDASRTVLSNKCVTMYFEIDYALYEANGSSIAATTNWMTSVFNNVQTLFSNDEITTSLRSIFIWTEQDPYNGSSSSDYLNQFKDLRPIFDADLGQLVGIDPGGLGGVAFLNGICNQNKYSYSDVNLSYSTVPTYSWTVQVITHELGHQMGSRHTHACAWNGNNTPIDGCGQQAGYSEGSCATGPIPSNLLKGTIMSYCHLISGVGIAFNNGFGIQPKNVILSTVNNGSCLGTDCVTTCINTITNVTATEITNNSVTVSWSDVGLTTSWQIAVLPVNSPFPNYINKNTPSHTFTGLTPNTFYRIRIRPVCGSLTATVSDLIFATTADWCNGVVITDTGGPNNNHGNLESYIRTFVPDQPNKKIKLEFSAFSLEENYDYLYIYDGPNTSSSLVNPEGYTGTNSPGTIISTAPDGSLTLRFESDPLEVAPGYIAMVSCEENLAIDDFQNINFSYYPNPTNGIVNVTSMTEMTQVSVYNIAGQLLYQNKINALDASVDISAFSTGTYFFRLKFGEYQKTFKVMKQ